MMKRSWKILLLAGIFGVLLCGSALAADTAGMYDVTGVTPKTGSGTAVTAQTVTIDGAEETLYAGAEKVTLMYDGAQDGSYYLVMALNDATALPTESNIAYIDQKTADGGTVTFDVYPGKLEAGKTYTVYLTSNDGVLDTMTEKGSFRYYVPYTLGDVDSNGKWTANDALYTLQIAVNRTTIRIAGSDVEVTEAMRASADVDVNGKVTANDALKILQKAVGKDVF